MKKFFEFGNPREHILHPALLRGVRGGLGRHSAESANLETV